MMPDDTPQIALRIPGSWARPTELGERLPEGCWLNDEGLVMPDGKAFELSAMPRDGQFAQVFQTACRSDLSVEERAALDRYRVNIVLMGNGGSLEAALAVMRAGAAIVHAGGMGVFIDNCALAHRGEDWVAMAEDGGSDAVSYAFAAIVRGQREIYTMGMHVMGFPDLTMLRSPEVDQRGEMMVDIIRYICGGNRPIEVGHFLGDEQGARFQVVARESDGFPGTSPMHNLQGRLKIVSVKEIAQGN